MSTQLRAAIRARDAFLIQLARRLTALAGTADPAAALRGFARELSIVAEPRRTVPLRRRRVALGRLVARTLREHGVCDGRVTFMGTGELLSDCDPEHVRTMLLELLSNALKYDRGRPVRVELRARGRWAELHVMNRGPWVGRLARPARFRRGDARRAAPPGFGIGLWLSRRLAAAHGGSLRRRSDGRSTRVSIRLPLAAPRRA